VLVRLQEFAQPGPVGGDALVFDEAFFSLHRSTPAENLVVRGTGLRDQSAACPSYLQIHLCGLAKNGATERTRCTNPLGCVSGGAKIYQ
jgi:hypothetical protein